MYTMGNKTKTKNFDNNFVSHPDSEDIESVIEVNSARSFIIPPKVLKQRQQFWEEFFLRYSHQFTDDNELDITTFKLCKSECRSKITDKTKRMVQHWVNTGYLPYQINAKKVDYIKSIDPDTGKPNINYMTPCSDESSLSSSVDTATYILQNINTTNKEKRMAIMGEAKPQSSTNLSDITYYENAEVNQTANNKLHEYNGKNSISNNDKTNNHSRCLITSDILLHPVQHKDTDLKENIAMFNAVVNTNSPLQDNLKPYSSDVLSKSYELPNNKSCEVPINKSCEVPVNKSCEVQINKSCEVPVNKSCEVPINKSCEVPVNKSCEVPINKSCEVPVNKSCEVQINKSCDLLNNKSCELANNKSCELPNNKSCELANNKSYENDASCELSKSQSTPIHSQQSYFEKSLLSSNATKIRHRKKLYTGRNSPVDLVTMKNCNKQVICKLKQQLHPALDFGYSLPKKLSIKRKRKLRQSCITNSNLSNVSQVISSYKKSVQTENAQNYFNLLHMTLANQSISTNDQDDKKKTELNNTTGQLEKIGSKTPKTSNNTSAQSEKFKSVVQSPELSTDNSRKCIKKPNKLIENLDLNPTVLLTRLSNFDIQKYTKWNKLSPVIRLRRLAKFDIQKCKKSTNITKNTKYLNAIVCLEKLSETAVKRYKTTVNMKKHSESNLLSDTFHLPYDVSTRQSLLKNTINGLQSSPDVIKITSNDTDSDHSTILMYRCNSKTSDTASNVSVFSKNNYKLHPSCVQTSPNNSLKTVEVNNCLTKDVQSEDIDNTLHMSTNLQDNLCSTLSRKSKVIPKNNDNDNAHTTSDKKIKLNSAVETSSTDDTAIKPRHYLRSRNLQDKLCSTLSRKSKVTPRNNDNDNVHTTSEKKTKLSSVVDTSDTDDTGIKPRHHLRSRHLQDNSCSTLPRKTKVIPRNSDDDNACTTSDKKMKFSSIAVIPATEHALIKPRLNLRARKTSNVIKEQDRGEFNNLNIINPCRESGKIKSKIEALVKSRTKRRNNHDINYTHFETKLFDSSTDSEFDSDVNSRSYSASNVS